MARTPTPIATMTLAGRWGPFTAAATERGLVAAEWTADPDEVRAGLIRRFGPLGEETAAARAHLDRARPVLETLVAGDRAEAVSLAVDLRDRPAWDQQVLAAVRGLGWGETASYGAIARRVGAPRAARAVGGALGRNPISLVIPCHRVIAADGTLGGYGGDGWVDRDHQLSRKQAMLLREGVTVVRRGE